MTKLLLLAKKILDKVPFNGQKLKIATIIAIIAFLKMRYPDMVWLDSIDPTLLAELSVSGAAIAVFHKFLKSKFGLDFESKDQAQDSWPTDN